ncbi:hypothetical protein L486_07221 [Kwoniella mangroviensis CBS 10435]|uniref:Uncharacterized protein n=1 Tax=Kwoniella mangroviensis CBS 10435 TaxID=1331196 RepID=A0A1B9II98_9TREE|nr:uncharacterized protein I203_08192 [Kwoniella mangroviensis CBS 8507]OCF55110.1 hypothetical protein L486_07221 [Kwoniella mangroviensis CBS 10435]OCF62780.1 hypothetical protein I203_08192 [Kwoniella mangroviensis CBS 8507]OCF72169.1 hypothetical protein I204_07434 [Kwoniella mangroviensis CBS 8886]
MPDTDPSRPNPTTLDQGVSTIPIQPESIEAEKFAYYTEHSSDQSQWDQESIDQEILQRARRNLKIPTWPLPSKSETSMVFCEITLSKQTSCIEDVNGDVEDGKGLNLNNPIKGQDGTVIYDPGEYTRGSPMRICNKDGQSSDWKITFDQLRSDHPEVYKDILRRWDDKSTTRVDGRVHVLRPFKDDFHTRTHGWSIQIKEDPYKTVWDTSEDLEFPRMSTETARWLAGSGAALSDG